MIRVDDTIRDERRMDAVIADHAGPGDLIVAPVAPTATGLREATTRIVWAAPTT